MSQMVVITGPERRRRWSPDQKQAVLAVADAPGAVVSEVARRADICTSLIYRWRKERRAEPGFVPARRSRSLTPARLARRRVRRRSWSKWREAG